jgi:hypothetical protein
LRGLFEQSSDGSAGPSTLGGNPQMPYLVWESTFAVNRDKVIRDT